ncbi:MAG: hypothetical protein HY001_03255 [Candidatus Portnoybacteria bacterium]|nr:hypothetical protein [Candidatus Portnoybacteria bacterium]
MNINQQLKQIGLTNSGIAVYLYLLENGLSTPPQIASGTSIARTNCYHILQSLKEKGLIAEQKRGKRKIYLARDPQALLLSLEQKREAVEQLLPDLRAFYTTQKNKPKIRFYEGLEEVKEIYWQSLEAEEIRALGSTKSLAQLDPKFFTRYQKEIARRGIVLSDILTHASGEKIMEETRSILKGLYDVELLPPKYKDIPTDMILWGDNVALITLQEPIFGTVLTSPLLAQTFRAIFNVMWEKLRESN